MKRFRLVTLIDRPFTAEDLGLPETATADDVYELIYKSGPSIFAEKYAYHMGMEIRVLESEEE